MDYQRYTEDYNEFPTWLRIQMEQTQDPRLKTLEGISRAIDVTRTTVYNWMSDKDTCRPRSESAMKLAKLFGRPVEEPLATYVSRRPGKKPSVARKYKLG